MKLQDCDNTVTPALDYWPRFISRALLALALVLQGATFLSAEAKDSTYCSALQTCNADACLSINSGHVGLWIARREGQYFIGSRETDVTRPLGFFETRDAADAYFSGDQANRDFGSFLIPSDAISHRIAFDLYSVLSQGQSIRASDAATLLACDPRDGELY